MDRNKLNLILQLLNKVETKGEQSLNDLLASIQLTKQLLAEVNQTNGMDYSRSIGGVNRALHNSGETNHTTHPIDTEDIRPVEQSPI